MSVPQVRQKPRRATSELWNHAISPRVRRNEALETGQMTANGPPTAFWHMRQWHTWTFSGGASQAKRTAPHWQPPVSRLLGGAVRSMALSCMTLLTCSPHQGEERAHRSHVSGSGRRDSAWHRPLRLLGGPRLLISLIS